MIIQLNISKRTEFEKKGTEKKFISKYSRKKNKQNNCGKHFMFKTIILADIGYNYFYLVILM